MQLYLHSQLSYTMTYWSYKTAWNNKNVQIPNYKYQHNLQNYLQKDNRSMGCNIPFNCENICSEAHKK